MTDNNEQSAPEQQSNLDTFARVANLVQNCDEPVKDTKDRAICEIAQSKDFMKMIRLSKFATELGEKFLSKLSSDEKFQTKDPHKILEIFQNMTDWEKFMECLDKSKSYTILPKTANEGAMVIFTYADGKTEQYPLEIGSDFWKNLTEPYAKKLAERKKEEEAKKIKKAKEEEAKKIRKEKEMNDLLDGIKEKLEETPEEKKERIENRSNESNNIIQSSKRLASTEAAYTELQNSTRFLSEDMLTELSVPLSQTSKLISEATVNPGNGHIELKDKEGFNKSAVDAFQIIKKYYPQYPKNVPENVMADLEQIAKKFPMD